MGTALADLASEALRLADVDPDRSAALASSVIEQAAGDRDLATVAVAKRAYGLAMLHLKDVDTAVRHLRSAIRTAQRAGKPRVGAEARMTLAFALSRLGQRRQALREIDAALRDLNGVAGARAQAQRGAILLQLDRFDEALASYRAALPVLRRARDRLWTQRVLTNRGILHGRRQEFAAAIADLTEADRLSRELGADLSGAHIQQNLGWIMMQRGEVPTALHHLDLAERRLRQLNAHTGTLLCDRGELLLSVGLISEARETAEQAVREFEREHRLVGLPEARLLLAHAALLDEDPVRAIDQAGRAVHEFRRQRRDRWGTLARYLVVAAQLDGPAPPGGALGRLRAVADALGAATWSAAELEARLLAARRALASGNLRQGRDQLERARSMRHRGPARLRARAWYAEALLRLTAGNRGAALSAIRRGLRILDDHRATIGATDLRAYASGHRLQLAELGLRMAIEDRSCVRVLHWAEQSRASHLLQRPVRPPDDPPLVRMLAELRTTVKEMGEPPGAGGATSRQVQRQVELERQIRDYCRTRPGSGVGPQAVPVGAGVLGAALGDAALVEYIQLGEGLYAETVVGGRMRLLELGSISVVQDLADRLPFCLHRLIRRQGTAASREAALIMLRDTAGRFDEVLLRPLRAHVGDRPLVVIPTGPLQSIPWSILPSCAGRPVTVSPSASLWHQAVLARGAAGRPAAVAAGPGLPSGRAEAEAVAAIYGTAPLVGAAATVEAVTGVLGQAGVVHLAAHGRVHRQNPLFSSILLADGPLTIYDVERLPDVPGLVVLASCESGNAVVCAGDELLGMSATFLSHGTQQLVASVVPVPDAETAPLMIAFHQLLAAGRPAPEALAMAQQKMAGDDALTAASAGFVCIGAAFSLSR